VCYFISLPQLYRLDLVLRHFLLPCASDFRRGVVLLRRLFVNLTLKWELWAGRHLVCLHQPVEYPACVCPSCLNSHTVHTNCEYNQHHFHQILLDRMALLFTSCLIFITAVLVNLWLPVKVTPHYYCYTTDNNEHTSGSLPAMLVCAMNISSLKLKPQLPGKPKESSQIMLYISILLLGNSGDVETNPGP